MNLRVLSCLLALILIFLMPAVPASATEPDPYLDFARQLFDQGDFFRAVTEAKRFLFLHPDHPRRTEARLLIARSYLSSGRFHEARQAFAQVIAQKDQPALAAEAALELGECLERLSPLDETITYYQELIANPPVPGPWADDVRNQARYRLGWLLLKESRWWEAQEVFGQIESDHRLGPPARELARTAPEGANIDLKSPTTAGVLSAVLPGAGQIYVGRPVDAGLAFGLNAAFLWGTIEAYNNESWAVFSLLGLMEAAWYGGNIYNAVNGAHIHNREARRDFLNRLEQKNGWRLRSTRHGPCLVWSWSLE